MQKPQDFKTMHNTPPPLPALPQSTAHVEEVIFANVTTIKLKRLDHRVTAAVERTHGQTATSMFPAGVVTSE